MDWPVFWSIIAAMAVWFFVRILIVRLTVVGVGTDLRTAVHAITSELHDLNNKMDELRSGLRFAVKDTERLLQHLGHTTERVVDAIQCNERKR